MADDFYPFVDSGDPAPDNRHITGATPDDATPAAADGATGNETMDASASNQTASDDPSTQSSDSQGAANRTGAHEPESTVYATRIAVYDDMLSTPRVLVVQPKDPRSYLEEVTNTVYQCMKEQGGSLSLMVIRELVENFIHAHFTEPIVSVLDGGNTIRFADQGPGITDKERAFEFGVTSADRSMKRYIRGTGAGLPMVQQYLENAGGAVSIEDNLGAGTVVTVSVDPARVAEIEANSGRGAAVRGAQFTSEQVRRSMAANRQWTGVYGQQYTASIPADASYHPQPELYAPLNNGYARQPEGYGQQPTTYIQQQVGYPQQLSQYPQQGGNYPTSTSSFVASRQPGQPLQQGFQQFGQKFSTIQQSPRQAGEISAPYTAQQASGGMPSSAPFLSERCLQALDFLAEHGQCGPTELTNTYGHSGPTWSRDLATLSGYGLITKHGRKYYLTELGTAWVAAHKTNE